MSRSPRCLLLIPGLRLLPYSAFAAGAVRIPVFGLQLLGLAPLDIPVWYAGLQALIGLVQVAIASAMYAGYRRHGMWGAF